VLNQIFFERQSRDFLSNWDGLGLGRERDSGSRRQSIGLLSLGERAREEAAGAPMLLGSPFV
jgi:hypothetical protein